jgi:hypothetical protein
MTLEEVTVALSAPIHPSLLKKVQEASYLTADNAHRYRPIMRHFYLQHGLHRYRLSLEEVRDFIRTNLDPAYTDEQAEQDLRQLVEWGALTAEQDRSRVRTVQDWLRRRPGTLGLGRQRKPEGHL